MKVIVTGSRTCTNREPYGSCTAEPMKVIVTGSRTCTNLEPNGSCAAEL
jgi:hypothetical protein